MINGKGIRVVALDLPTSHLQMKMGDEFTDRMLSALNSMMLDMLAAIARKDYDDRKRRQAQWIKKAKLEGKYTGKPINQSLHDNIRLLREKGMSYSQIQAMLGCGRATIAKVAKSA